MLSPGAIKRIHKAIDELFARAKAKLLGKDYGTAKRVSISTSDDATLPGLYGAAAKAAGAAPDADVANTIRSITGNYLDAQLAAAKAKVVNDVATVLQDAERQGVATDVSAVLGGRLAETWGGITAGVRRIAETETTTGRNLGLLEGINKLAALNNVEDPVVFWVIVRDAHVCDECVSLHMLTDGITPRVWKLSEVAGGYHKRGDGVPSVRGLHPHCRCMLTTLMPGYGFDGGGHVKFVSSDHDEYARQHS
jgi:hypothetical protein